MRRLLLVDEDPLEGEQLAQLLSVAGYAVASVSSGEAALVEVSQERPDLLLVSATLTGLSASDLCRLFLGDAAYTDLPVILLTPRDDFPAALDAVCSGAHAFMTRPVDSATLLSRTRSVLARTGRGQEAASGPVRVDLAGRSFQTSTPVRTMGALAFALEEALFVNSRLQARNGELAAAHGALARYTQRIESESELSDGKYRALLRDAKDGILVADTRGTLIEINECGKTLLGVSNRKVLGRPLFEGVQVSPHIAPESFMDLAVLTDATCEVVLGPTAGSREKWLELSLSRMSIGEDEALVLIVARDVTEKRRAVDELRTKENALRTAIDERDRMQTDLVHAQKLEAVGQLAAGIAHEINTPTQYIGDNVTFLRTATQKLEPVLVAYSNLAEVVRRGEPAEQALEAVDQSVKRARLDYLRAQVPRAIDQSLEGIERVATIVQAMKEFSHPGTEEKTLLDLNRAIQSTTTVARNEWKYVADLDLDLDAELPLTPCLPGEINQAVLNMVINAAHAIAEKLGEGAEQKGKITVRTRAEGDHVVISIADTGGGIPQAIQTQIFNPFFTTKKVGKGTGQGLAIARSVVVDKHGGRLFFESKEGEGTTFFVWLPLNDAVLPEQQRSA